MSVNTTVELQCLAVPTFTYIKRPPGLKQDGFNSPEKIHLRDLDPETLKNLCDELVANIFEDAGQEYPKIVAV